jgi:SET domain-containing protein
MIKKSKINEKGAFAARDFKKGEIVLHWDTTQQLTKAEMDKLPILEKENYVSLCNGKLTHMQAPERYVNHSCNPNTTVKDFCDVAIREIKKGEEITSDYANDAHSANKTMKCTCGANKCKKII